MINPLNILLVILFLIIVPFLLGLLLERNFDKSLNVVAFSRVFIMGFAIMLCAFQAVAGICIYKGTSFDFLLYLYTGILIALIVVALLLNRKRLLGVIPDSVKAIKEGASGFEKEYLIIGIITLLLIVFQTSLLIFRTHMDTDDCRFLAESLEAIEKNTLLRVHPITGENLAFPIGEMKKEIFSPYPIWIAVISVYTRIHPTVLAHGIFPALLIPLAYSVYYLLGTHFFEDRNKRIIYMFILSVIMLFSFESIYSLGYTLLTIIWQGRSIVATSMAPFLWYILEKIYNEENTGILSYLTVLIVSLAIADLSGTGAMIPPVIGAAFALSSFIKNRKIMPSVLMVMAVIPSGIYSILYTKSWTW